MNPSSVPEDALGLGDGQSKTTVVGRVAEVTTHSAGPALPIIITRYVTDGLHALGLASLDDVGPVWHPVDMHLEEILIFTCSIHLWLLWCLADVHFLIGNARVGRRIAAARHITTCLHAREVFDKWRGWRR